MNKVLFLVGTVMLVVAGGLAPWTENDMMDDFDRVVGSVFLVGGSLFLVGGMWLLADNEV